MRKLLHSFLLEDYENIRKIIQKIAFPIEFVLALFCVYSFYEMVVGKAIVGSYSFVSLGIFFLSLLGLLYLILFQCKYEKEKIEKLTISFLIPISIFYLFFMLPTYVPDENAHIWKAYEISTGKWVTKIEEDGTANSYVPEFFEKNQVYTIGNYRNLEKIKQEKTDYQNLTLVDSPAKAYPTVLYCFSSIGFALARTFHLNGVFAIYLARICNTIVFLLFSYYSIKIIPFGKKVLVTLFFLPMTLQQCTSISADSLMNSVSFFYIAYTLSIIMENKKLTLKRMLLFGIMSVLLAVSKIAYCPLVGIVFLFISMKNSNKRTKGIFISTVLVLSAILAVGYYAFMQQYPAAESAKVYMEANHVEPSEQIQHILKNPTSMIPVFIESINQDGYLRSMLGSHLGWLNIEISSSYITLFLVFLVLAPFMEKNEMELKKSHKIWLLFLALATYWLVFLALYITWTPVGNVRALGVQGRYFLPIVPFVFLCFCKKNQYISYKHMNLLWLLALSFLNLFVIRDIYQFFIG